MDYAFRYVDVFGAARFRGNPLPVVFADERLCGEAMQDIARWFNASETTFVLPPTDPGADYRVRIFTLERELPFAGHPTLGSCHAWLANGGRARGETMVQQCGAGLVPIRRIDSHLAFRAPPLVRSGAVESETLDDLAGFLGITRDDIVAAAWADNGPGWIVVLLESAERVLALRPAATHPRRIDVGVVGPWPAGADAAWEIRAFFSDHRGVVREDPVTGSLNASTAQWLFATGRAHGAYVAAQGACVGAAGRIHVTRDADGEVWVGGATFDVAAGRLQA